MKPKILYIVVPCYNEEEVLEETTKRLDEKLKGLIKKNKISSQSKILYINDGSKDETWNIIKKECKRHKSFMGICLSKNRGHQNALLAGLLTAKEYADIIISMDADLQDDINAIDEMVEKYYDGAEIVYGVRNSRKKDTWFKRTTAELFYKFMKKMGVDIIYNHADFRLTSKNVLEHLSEYKESNLFLRGIFPTIGFKTDLVYYERAERFAGESKYPLKKMLSFAWEGITSFSIKPLRIISIISLINDIICFFYLIGAVISKLRFPHIQMAYIIFGIIWFILSLLLTSVSLIGEYVGKIYIEIKSRPRFIISEKIGEFDNKTK